MADKPLVLVDGSSYLYRAFHALPDLSTQDGQPTGALLGVLNMIYKLVDEHAPERMAVVFDAAGKTFRDDLYADYKANRTAMPDDLRSQIAPLLDAIDKMGIPVLRIAGVEADDVIGTLADAAARAGLTTVISTSDKDMAQLVSEQTTLVNTMDNTTLDPAGVAVKFGVPPERISDYLALVGDTSDNIPGVRGVGMKTAAKWLEQYGSLEGIVEHSAEIGGKVGEQLRASLGQLDLYKQLATIDRRCELPVGVDELAVRAPRQEELRALYERLELTSLQRRRLPQPEVGTAAPPAPAAADLTPQDYEFVRSLPELDALLAELEAAPLVAVNTETSGPAYMEAELVGIGFSTRSGRGVYVPFGHHSTEAAPQLDRTDVLARLRPWLESEAPKVAHDGKFDAHVLDRYGIRLNGLLFDVMLESYVLNSVATRHDRHAIAAKYLGIETLRFEDVCGKGVKQVSFEEVDIERACPYAAGKADATLRSHLSLWPRLREAPELERLYVDIERPLLDVLQAMERAGVMVDAAMLLRQGEELAAAMTRTEIAAHAEAGGAFALASPKQLQEVLYERLALPVLGKTPKGQPSTAEAVLQELARTYELPRLILEYRALAKLKSTYTDKLPREITTSTGRIHTSYHQAVAATGRLSSTDPNLQNIPIRTAEGRRIRQAFVAPRGYALLAADYSQIELRIMAHLSADQGLLDAFAAREDVHRATAAEVFGVPLAEVSPDQRRSAKAINFGLIYGMSAFGLGRQLGVERAEAQHYIDLYFERYPGVKRYMDETRQLAREQGYVSTVFGRRLYLPDIRDRNAQRRQYAERSAINAPMQGTAADIIKIAMLRLHAWLTAGGADARLIMQVHDELVLEVREEQAQEVAGHVVRLMEAAADLSVPLQVDAGIGANWDEAH